MMNSSTPKKNPVQPRQQSWQSKRSSRLAFTLVELLVVMSILLILAGITLATINVTMNSERIGMGSRQVQAFIEGARDRALHAGQPRGVRFIIDQNLSDSPGATNPKFYCRSMVYIGPPTLLNNGFVSVDTSLPNTELTSFPSNWNNYYQRGLLADGARIRIFNSTETNWYILKIVDDGSGNISQVFLTRSFTGSSSTGQSYELQLEPAVLPLQEPRQFAQGIVIDVANSDVPTSWRSGTTFQNTKLDIMYGPNGAVFGPAASSGSIHLLLADIVDTAQGRGPGDPNKEGGEQIISIITKTGTTSTHAVHFPQTWAPSRKYEFGQWVHPTGNTTQFFICTQAGSA
ncbi:hypothetical protein MNBD_PLANCTO02-2907, partial [hydrothermal vent metagenome]